MPSRTACVCHSAELIRVGQTMMVRLKVVVILSEAKDLGPRHEEQRSRDAARLKRPISKIAAPFVNTFHDAITI
jgi:hypothetical protein